MFLPLGVGIVSLVNVELSAKNRLKQTDEAQGTMEGRTLPAVPGESSSVSGGGNAGMGGRAVLSASEKRRLVARKAREGETVRVRGYATARTVQQQEEVGVSVGGGPKPNTARIVTNILRFASVAFIPVAGLAPSVRLPSSLFSSSMYLTRSFYCRLFVSTGSHRTFSLSFKTESLRRWIGNESRKRGWE